MASFVVTGTLTNAGKTLIDNAKNNALSLKVTKIVFTNYTGSITANTTSIGSVLETAKYYTQATNLLQTRMEFEATFKGQANDTLGTLAVYVDATIICLVRFTMPSNENEPPQIAIRATYANSSVFAKPASTISASLLGEIHKKSWDDCTNYLLNGGAGVNKSLFGAANSVREADFFNTAVNILENASEMNMVLSTNPVNGTVAYYLPNFKKYVISAGTWVVDESTTLNQVIKGGRFYNSLLTNSLYYARSSSDLLKVATQRGDAHFEFTMPGNDSFFIVTVVNAGGYYWTDLSPIRIPFNVTGVNPVQISVNNYKAAKKGYFQFTRYAANSRFELIASSATSIDNWDTYPLNQIGLMCETLQKVPTKLPPAITSLNKTLRNVHDQLTGYSTWDVSNITDFSYCFMKTEVAFYSGVIPVSALTSWNVSNGTNFEGMFISCMNSNPNIVSWNMGKATNIKYMFKDCAIFNRNLSSWRFENSKVTSTGYDENTNAWLTVNKPTFI